MGNLTNQILNDDSEYSLDEWENLKSENVFKTVYEKKHTHNSTKSQKKNSGASLPI